MGRVGEDAAGRGDLDPAGARSNQQGGDEAGVRIGKILKKTIRSPILR